MNALILLFVSSFVLLGAFLLRRGRAGGTDLHALHLVCIDGPAAGAAVSLEQHAGISLGIGRAPDNAIQLTDPAVSREHAWVIPAQGGATIRDACSANGVWIDGRRVFDERLGAGDQFQIGAHIFALVAPGALAPEPRIHEALVGSHDTPHEALADYALAEVLHVGKRFVLRRAQPMRDPDCGPIVFKQLSGVEAHVHARDALGLRGRLTRHIRQMRGLRHRHCVSLLGGNAECDTPFLIETYAAGGSLQRTMRASWRPEDVARLMHDVGCGLAFLHANGVVHGDLTPRDILFDATGAALVANGGLERVFAAGAVDASLSAPNARGDRAYRAPELGRPGAASIAGDVFALGAIGYQLLSGHAPVLPRRGALRSPGESPAVLDAIISRALHRDPAQRWPDMDTMAGALAQLAPPEAAGADAAVRPIRLLVPGTQRLIPVNASPFVLGRMLLNPSDRELSRQHATLLYQDNAWSIATAPGAVNGVLLNQCVIEPGRARMINPGDELLLGVTAVRIVE
jgi:pSer/pThr/pTyr-binding forkhead associated (FHA) protein